MRTAVLRATFAEAYGRKVVTWGLIASGAFLALFAVGFTLLYREISTETADLVRNLAAGGLLTILGLYVSSFLACFLSLTLSASSISADVDSGVTQAVAVRPLTRRSWYLQRWGGLSLLATLYVLAMTAGIVGIAFVISGYRPQSTPALVGLLVLQTVFLVSAGMLVSSRLSTMAAGVLLFFYFGLSWLAGFIGFIGSVSERPDMVDMATAVSMVAPSDAVWKAASSYAAPAGINMGAMWGGQWPFASFSPPSTFFVAWVVGLTLLTIVAGGISYSRRDL